jgi:hypothetical protein
MILTDFYNSFGVVIWILRLLIAPSSPSFQKDSPRTINDYMPIYLLNSSLKLLTKLLANRLQSVILSVVHTN